MLMRTCSFFNIFEPTTCFIMSATRKRVVVRFEATERSTVEN